MKRGNLALVGDELLPHISDSGEHLVGDARRCSTTPLVETSRDLFSLVVQQADGSLDQKVAHHSGEDRLADRRRKSRLSMNPAFP